MEYFNLKSQPEPIKLLRYIQDHINTFKKFELLLKTQKSPFKNDYEYVDHALSMLTPFKGFSNDLQSLVTPRLLKCPRESQNLRNLGNIAFRSGCYLDAHNFYTLSIARGKAGSKELSLAYGNRSAVLFEKQFYKECLEDIQRAFDNNYPSDKKAKLLNRRAKAKQLLPTQKKVPFHGIIPTIKNRNISMPSASDCIQLNKNEEFGCHIVANRTIKPGEILLVEKPYSQITFPETGCTYCSECLELCYNTIPCEKCAGVLYCSITCRKKAYVNYHRYECVILSYFGYDIINWTATRITLKGIINYENEDTDSTDVYRSDRYKEISELMCDKSSQNSNLKYLIVSAIGAAKVFYVLKHATDIFSVFDVDNKENILKTLLFNDNCIQKANGLAICQRMVDNDFFYGTAIYSVLSMFNHACSENVGLFYYGSTAVLTAKNKIMKGEQCFINYGISPITTETTDRQLYIYDNFNFICKCQACVQKWPREGEVFNLEEMFLLNHWKDILSQIASNDHIDQQRKRLLLQIMERIQERSSCLYYECAGVTFKKMFEGNIHIPF